MTEDFAASILKVLGKNPERLVFSDAQNEWTCARVLSRMNEIVRHLDSVSSPGDRVTIALPNSVEFAATLLAVIVSKRIPALLDRSNHTKTEHLSIAHPSSNLHADLILSTSGTSGTAKAVRHSQMALKFVHDHIITRFSLDESSVTAITMPLTHTFALNTQFFPVFWAGGRCHFVEESIGLAKSFDAIVRSRSTFVSIIGSLLPLLRAERQHYGTAPAIAVKHVQMAGDFVTKAHWQTARELFPNAQIHVGYGSSETLRVSMAKLESDEFEPGYAGQVLAGEKVEIRSGEVFVSGPNIMLGYDEESPVAPDGFFATGDLGFLRNGHLFISGRKDRLFKVNGRFVSPAAIEQSVRTCAGIQVERCACLPAENMMGERVPVVFVELERGAEDLTPSTSLVQAIANIFGPEKLNLNIILHPHWILTHSGKLDLIRMAEQARHILQQKPVVSTRGCSFRYGSLPTPNPN